ncbi:MAG: hypothetical protein CO029_03960 [Candidatus Magasanikbacteria bacterium CG_4_9_14_0_2_um_filter_41_10]|uniref:Major facilitator superfamily (MFS) profile domain-containing protein n=1 Tax=Candidatus Magasanikbacteria bacterium CG_4_10_14_0_2_um_filter_41_31 TaxID=1974639 RepID=A0A2M7V4D2_9BACT|nr:MAG: hypothetical protein AUJ37_00855 [Candidatus Magasanikbacteria bacterium CG1_02_41_34]PIZ93418.1 MAG: hypothetical protein COX83_02080 [Candidatus Magasanikbacteria bacterium CG_4_10_14_0_2_um_filter_41_31]PJC53220.1 MAG: hypothetical protein CO029_03960 [Candidatus Magasanikbacteria bacterium CG_4_9_14_0_2_um_filter_41_10]
MIFGTLMCWAGWGVVLWNIDPYEAGIVSFMFFYITLFLALTGTISTALYTVYHFFGDVQIPVFRYVQRSMGYGLSAASVLVVLLLAHMFSLLNVWSMSLLVLIAAFVLSLKLSKRRPYIPTYEA